MEHIDPIDHSNHTAWANGQRESFEDFDYVAVDRALLRDIKTTPADVRAAAAEAFAKILAWVSQAATPAKSALPLSGLRLLRAGLGRT